MEPVVALTGVEKRYPNGTARARAGRLRDRARANS
jgi:hypothetical protein